MLRLRYSLAHGDVLSISDLRRVLSDLGNGPRQWWIADTVSLVRDKEEPIFWLTLFHSNPAPGQMTDELSFEVPVIADTVVSGKEEEAMVCLHPDVMRPLVEGLYMERDRVVGDIMEDWHLFWRPIKQRMFPNDPESA